MQQRVWRSEVGRNLPPGHGAMSTIRASRRRRSRPPILTLALLLAGAALIGAVTASPSASVFLGMG
jgi:hypothetical protein